MPVVVEVVIGVWETNPVVLFLALPYLSKY
jgi:hypothetical protein